MLEVYFSSLTFTSWFIPTPFSVFHTLSQVLSNTIVVRHAMILCRTSIQSGIIYNYNTSILNLIWTSTIHSWKIVFVVISLLKVLTKKNLRLHFGVFPVHCPVDKHFLVSFPTIEYPLGHLYVALVPTRRVPESIIRLSLISGSLQVISRQTGDSWLQVPSSAQSL